MLNNNKSDLAIKNTLQDLGISYGYILSPIILRPLFKNYLNTYSKSKMNIDKTRNLVDIFLLLCNEWYIHYEINTTDEFFIEQYKLREYYCVGRKAFENSIKILKQMRLINYKNKWNNQRRIRRRWFTLNTFEIKKLLERAKKISVILKEQKPFFF